MNYSFWNFLLMLYTSWMSVNRVPMDINSLRAVECIPAVCGHTKHLRSAIAFQILLGYFDNVHPAF